MRLLKDGSYNRFEASLFESYDHNFYGVARIYYRAGFTYGFRKTSKRSCQGECIYLVSVRLKVEDKSIYFALNLNDSH
ncbi:hypothetical protein GCM10027191_25950 [Novilysobacter erysipheiresistens]